MAEFLNIRDIQVLNRTLLIFLAANIKAIQLI